ncbi:phage portal protein, partial [Patescibacteria group bacterium]|nr:phage portal protein [Patescibacteria group bacterium]
VIANKETGIVTGYVYQNELTRAKTVYPINPITGESDILHMKTFNPLDDYYGTPAIDPARLDIDTNNEAGKWNSALMQNGAKPGTAFVAKGPMSDKEYERLEKTIMEKYSGAANAGKSILINTPDTTDVKHLGFSPADMDYLEGERKTARRIALAFGVPPQLLGIPGDSTYSNYKEARTAFWEDTVMYWLNFYKEELNWWFFGGTNVEYYIDFDLNDVPALAYKQDLKWDRAIKSDFLKENEKRNMVGYDSVEGGDAVYKPASEMAAYGDDMLIPNIEENETQVEEEEDEAVEKLQQIGLTLEEAENVIGVQNDSKRISCKNDYIDGHK